MVGLPISGLTHILLFYVGKESEKFWKEGKEGVLPHHPKALVVVLRTAEAAIPELLRMRLELLKLERLAADEIGDGGDLQPFIRKIISKINRQKKLLRT